MGNIVGNTLYLNKMYYPTLLSHDIYLTPLSQIVTVQYRIPPFHEKLAGDTLPQVPKSPFLSSVIHKVSREIKRHIKGRFCPFIHTFHIVIHIKYIIKHKTP
jgi:hypothetical protein